MADARRRYLSPASLALVLAGCASAVPTDARPTIRSESNPIAGLAVALARVEAGVVQEERRVQRRMGPGRWLRFRHCEGLGVQPIPYEGTVRAVDAEQGVFLVSVGSKHGVKWGDGLVAFRGDEVLGVLVIDKVFEDKASAVYQSIDGKAMRGSDLRVGDGVASVY